MGLRGPGAWKGVTSEKARAKAESRKHSWQGRPVSAEQVKPWELDGVSRATWYRRKRAARQTAPDGLKDDSRSLSRVRAVLDFLGKLPVPSGARAGERFKVIKWEADVVDALYSTGEDGKRTVRQALITLPRKNGKTGFIAGLCLAHLCGPEAETNGEIYSAAADRDQAAIIFRMMKQIVAGEPWLSERLVIRQFDKTIEDVVTGSVYKALSADAGTKHGTSSSFVVYDELAQAPNRTLFDVLATSGAARAEPLLVVISTQSPDPNHVLSEMVSYGRKVNAGTVNDPFFHAVIYEAPREADPWAEETWLQCNPGMPYVRSLKEMQATAAQAQAIPTREPAFRNLYLNQPVDPAPSFLSVAEWRECADSGIDIDALEGHMCYGGLDLADTRDLNAFALYFPDTCTLIGWAWVAEGAIREKAVTDKVPYAQWIEEGHVLPSPGRAVNKRDIVKHMAGVASRFDLVAVGFDPWGITEVERIRDEEGVPVDLEKFSQRFESMSPAIAELEGLILERKLRHQGSPLMEWAFSNVVVEEDSSSHRRFGKARARDRIDPMIAAVMAVGMAGRSEGPYTATDGWLVGLDADAAA